MESIRRHLVELQLKGRNVLITGSGSGIGRTMALMFANEGANIAVNDIAPAGINETLQQLEAFPVKAIAAQCDITDLNAVKSTFADVNEKLGSIDILVNNAAKMTSHEMYLDTDPDDCEIEIRVSLFGTLNCTRAALPYMVERQYGKVVNIVTDAARLGQARQTNYSAAKGGVISFTKSIAKEVGRFNINVNAVSPGATNSPMRQAMVRDVAEKLGEAKAAEREEKVRRAYALRRIGEPEDIAAMTVFLGSDMAKQITGQIISVNGGFAMPG